MKNYPGMRAMSKRLNRSFLLMVVLLFASFSLRPAVCQEPRESDTLDERVDRFLENNRYKWRDWNIPYADGKILYDLIIKNNYTRALEIGTSTGHSAIWIAWALSKTGGKLITIEIDERRYKQALANFEEAGLSDYIDARRADAHELVEQLPGPFDFVFADADKNWSKKYFMLLAPKLVVGGAYTAHNAANTEINGIRQFMDYVSALPNFTTKVDTTSSAGISISYKTAEK